MEVTEAKTLGATTELSEFERIALEMGREVTQKHVAYGESMEDKKVGAIMAILYPNGVAVNQYVDFLIAGRLQDKLFRIATDRDAFAESPYRDMGGYCLIGERNTRRHRKEASESYNCSTVVADTQPLGRTLAADSYDARLRRAGA